MNLNLLSMRFLSFERLRTPLPSTTFYHGRCQRSRKPILQVLPQDVGRKLRGLVASLGPFKPQDYKPSNLTSRFLDAHVRGGSDSRSQSSRRKAQCTSRSSRFLLSWIHLYFGQALPFQKIRHKVTLRYYSNGDATAGTTTRSSGVVAPTYRPSSPPPFDSDVIAALHLDFHCHSTRMSVLFAYNGVRFRIIRLGADVKSGLDQITTEREYERYDCW
jgi:hypothetical protein